MLNTEAWLRSIKTGEGKKKKKKKHKDWKKKSSHLTIRKFVVTLSK